MYIPDFIKNDHNNYPTFNDVWFVTHPDHLKKLPEPRKDLLIVSSDWLLVNDLEKIGYKTINIEFGLINWEENKLETDLYMTCTKWAKINDLDQSFFKGVPISETFSRNTSLIMIATARIQTALEKIFDIFNVKRCFMIDVRCEFGLLTYTHKLKISTKCCKSRNIEFFNLIDSKPDTDQYFSQNPTYNLQNRKSEFIVLIILRILYCELFIILSKIFEIISPKRFKKVLFSVGGRIADGILKEKKFDKITPYLNISTIRKKPLDHFKFLFRGGRFYLVRGYRKNVSNKAEIKLILKKLISIVNKDVKKSLSDEIINHYVLNEILNSELIEERCNFVEKLHKSLTRKSFDEILVDSPLGLDSICALYIAKNKNIRTNYIWHGLWFHAVKFPSLSNKANVKNLVDKVFTWGKHNELWLDAIDFRNTITRTGNPFLFHNSEDFPRIFNQSKKRVLLLQYTPMNTDLKGLNMNQYEYFVKFVRFFNELSDVEVILKLHPGIPRVSYYETIVNRYNLNCKIYQNGNFQNYLKCADIVIGPAQSGAYIESLFLSKPYLPVLLSPFAKITDVSSCKIFGSVEEILSLGCEIFKFKNSPNELEYFSSLKENPFPIKSLIQAFNS